MGKMTKPPKNPVGPFTLGRMRFSKISAVEGIKIGRSVEAEFEKFDRQGLPAEERRRQLTKKLVRKS
mgnify:CR=1 FL=1